MRRDAVRTAVLERLGFRLIRFHNDDVFSDVDAVAEIVLGYWRDDQETDGVPLRGGYEATELQILSS